jgi:hypothetical protein
MSHFTGYVFGDLSNLDRYDEGIEMEPYIESTKEEAIKLAVNHYKELIEVLNSCNSRLINEISRELSEGHELSDGVNQDRVIRNLIQIKKITELLEDPEKCYDKYFGDSTKNDNGDIMSTYNPDSKWDWYSIGGRFDGELQLKNGDVANEATVKEVDWSKTYSPFCFVSEDGEWHACADIGMFAITSNDKPEEVWEKEFADYIKYISKEGPDVNVTVIDFHI